MSSLQIGVLIVAAIALLVVGGLVMQGIENQRREKRLRLLALRDQVRRTEHLLGALPPELTSPAMRQLLINHQSSNWQAIGTLDRNEPVRLRLEELRQLAAQPGVAPMVAQGLTLYREREQARLARAVLREYAKFLTDLQQSGQYSVDVLQPIMNETKIAHARAGVDLELLSTRQLEQQRGPVVALHQYRSCLRKLDKLGQYVDTSTQRRYLEQQIAEGEQAQEQQRLAQEEAIRAAEEADQNPFPDGSRRSRDT